jgi:hypothetical protein
MSNLIRNLYATISSLDEIYESLRRLYNLHRHKNKISNPILNLGDVQRLNIG